MRFVQINAPNLEELKRLCCQQTAGIVLPGASVSNPAFGEPVTAGAPWPVGDFRPCQEEFVEILCGTPEMQSSRQRWCGGKANL